MLLFILWLILGDHSSTLVIDSRTITVGTARNDLFNDYIRVNGTVQPITILQLSPLEGGVVEKRNIEEGNTVKEGDVILTLSNQNLSASVLESESQLADRVNALRNAQIQMEQDRLNQQKEQFATDLDIQRKKRQYQQKEKLYNEKLIARGGIPASQRRLRAGRAQPRTDYRTPEAGFAGPCRTDRSPERKR